MTGRRRQLWIGIAVLLVVQLTAILLYRVSGERTTRSPNTFAVETLTPRNAPQLTFERSDELTGSLAQLRGKVVMVHFWATWCVPCREELPGLLALAGELTRTHEFELIAVSVDDDWDTMRRFFGETIPSGVVRPDGTDVHRRFGASTLPDTYLVDARGYLVARYTGARDWKVPRARTHLAKAITTHGVR
ncbi:MAG: redoxin domain-containing protein [Kofleriaceae bacterium]